MTLTELLIQSIGNLFSFDEKHPLLFTQFYFWAFFALVFAVFALIRNRILLRNAFLFFVSVFFYYKTSGLFTLILLFVILYCYLAGKWIDRCSSPRGKWWVLVTSIGVNLLTLCYFKYAYFLTDLVNNLLGTKLEVYDYFAALGNLLGGDGRFDTGSILLPVGISFFIFQAISYVMDVYREKIRPVKNVLDFGFYVSFFPQLVAGPIVRANEFIPQLHKKFFLGRRQFGIAVFWIVNGLAKKIVLSDYIAVNFIDRVFDNPRLYSGFENLVGLFGYSLQVYADFSGYTDIAIGVAMLMGFYLPQNFHSPYKATNPGGFWKRWHISLSKWLQEYLYIPMGGNREASYGTFITITAIALIAAFLSGSWPVATGLLLFAAVMGIVGKRSAEKRKKITTNLNRMNTMLLGGLWHGASWNFMIWGGLNGIGMIVYQFWRDFGLVTRVVAVALATALFAVLCCYVPAPGYRIGVVWCGVILLGAVVRCVYKKLGGRACFGWLERAWSILLTFVFITFTRLFFRAGSNLNPKEANEVAWKTAQSMVEQIGSPWNTQCIPDVCVAYKNVFLMIVLGMVIHWLPEDWKRRYRLMFASLPLPVMAVAVVLIVFVLYQFVTADLQKFIYFQF
jgi:D-alanyl-lipoteichoic acid acyltransferase DltB (MBOAT superfamily)